MAAFVHEALMYEGIDAFAAGTAPFVEEGLAAGEPVLVATGAANARTLRDALGTDAETVKFVDMEELGRNPGRIMAAWADFVADRAPGVAVRGIGEPVWPGRTPAELLECQLHESLLNLAFAEADDFRLLCPYDQAALDPETLHAVGCSHRVVHAGDDTAPTAAYRAEDDIRVRFAMPLQTPRGTATVLAFDRDQLDEVRAFVGAQGRGAGLDAARTADSVLAVNEVAANSIRHGGGRGVLRVWREDDSLIFEVRDCGVIEDPLVGRRRPPVDHEGGWGLYVAHHVCDLVQLRSGPQGTVVQMRMHAA